MWRTSPPASIRSDRRRQSSTPFAWRWIVSRIIRIASRSSCGARWRISGTSMSSRSSSETAPRNCSTGWRAYRPSRPSRSLSRSSRSSTAHTPMPAAWQPATRPLAARRAAGAYPAQQSDREGALSRGARTVAPGHEQPGAGGRILFGIHRIAFRRPPAGAAARAVDPSIAHEILRAAGPQNRSASRLREPDGPLALLPRAVAGECARGSRWTGGHRGSRTWAPRLAVHRGRAGLARGAARRDSRGAPGAIERQLPIRAFG